MWFDLAPWLALTVMAAGCAGLVWRLHGARRALAAACDAAETADAAEQSAMRVLRLAAHELQSAGLRVRGHAEILPPGPAGAELAAVAAQLLGLADELQDHAPPSAAGRVLRETLIDPLAALRAAIAAINAAIAPARRHWRLPERTAALLWADGRALRHILGRILADAARNTRHEDWIDLSLHADAEGLTLTVEDEGSGLAAPEPAPSDTAVGDSRGIGLRLALARALMVAHGGRLEVTAVAAVGTRVSLIFPPERLRRAPAESGQPG